VAGYGGFSSIVEKNLYFFQSAEITAELQHESLETVQNELGYLDETSYLRAHPEQAAWTQAERLSYMRIEAKRILAAHPWMYLRSHFAGVGVVAFTPCAAEWLELTGIYPNDGAMPRRVLNEGIGTSALRVIAFHPGVALTMAIFEAYLVCLYGLSVWGLLAWGSAGKQLSLLVGICMYFVLIAGGAQAVGRYRTPAMPEVCVLAAGGVVALRGRRQPASQAVAQER
jgi:hypothetical protein